MNLLAMIVITGMCLVGFLFGVFFVESIINKFDEFKKKAIEKGYAMHDPKTGEWKWKE